MTAVAATQDVMLFTIILDFEGVNSVSQVVASSPDDALLIWEQRLAIAGRYGLTSEATSDLTMMLANERRSRRDDAARLRKVVGLVRPVSEVQNVWCLWLSLGKRAAVLNIVASIGQTGISTG